MNKYPHDQDIQNKVDELSIHGMKILDWFKSETVRRKETRKKATESAAVPTPPLTVSLRSTTELKHSMTVMNGLDLKSPLQKKNKVCDREEASLVDSVDYEDPATIAWQTKGGVASAI